MEDKIPRSKEDDYSREMAIKRQAFMEEKSGVKIQHINQYSFDPALTKGNIEHFTGVAQVPIGIAGPLLINGEHAKGEFYVPLATSEGTLVASYNRGMKIIQASGGVTVTISDDAMQRAPVFIFNNAREARDLGTWIDENFENIKKVAEGTTRVGKLRNIEKYYSNKFIFLRFNFTTGDAAGQNMTTKATFVVTEWIMKKYDPGFKYSYILDGNIATDKKGSRINMLHTRGKRVTAEIVIPDPVIREHLRQSPFRLMHGMNISSVGAFMTGSQSNANHTANGITALFIATGQDVANVAESSAAIMFTERTKEGDLYYSITIPSLIVATYGGGTGLATQRECLELLGCYGKGKVNKLAEIIAATAMAGEISLMSAIGAKEWASSHDEMGRNRP
jgi:hydroxymethylglutaryl-CoA reductase (NADPH)